MTSLKMVLSVVLDAKLMLILTLFLQMKVVKLHVTYVVITILMFLLITSALSMSMVKDWMQINVMN